MKKKPHLVTHTQNAQHLMGDGLADFLPPGTQVLTPTKNKEGSYYFPDGETYLRLPGLKDIGNITIVHSGYPKPNDGLIELYMMLDIIRKYRKVPGKVHAVITCMPYARQDNAFYDGEPSTAEFHIQTLMDKGVTDFSIIDAHFAGEPWVKKYPIKDFSVTGLLISHAREKHPDLVLMTPDEGSRRRTSITEGTDKTRRNSYDVTMKVDRGFERGVRGNAIGVVDDILSTGTTLQKFRTAAMDSGAEKIAALITHGVNPLGIALTKSTFDGGLFMSNTVNQPEANVSVQDFVWKLIKRSITHAK